MAALNEAEARAGEARRALAEAQNRENQAKAAAGSSCANLTRFVTVSPLEEEARAREAEASAREQEAREREAPFKAAQEEVCSGSLSAIYAVVARSRCCGAKSSRRCL